MRGVPFQARVRLGFFNFHVNRRRFVLRDFLAVFGHKTLPGHLNHDGVSPFLQPLGLKHAGFRDFADQYHLLGKYYKPLTTNRFPNPHPAVKYL